MKLNPKLKRPLIACIIIICWPVAILIEFFSGSHRYIVDHTVKTERQVIIVEECLGLIDGLKRQEELEKKASVAFVYRNRMNVFYKWYKCGVL